MRFKLNKYKPKFFPFSAGIPWKIERGKYIIPEIDSETWHKVLDGRDITIVAFGGLFESFFSLVAAEALVSFDSAHRIYWLGNQEYNFFVRSQNICKLSLLNVKKSFTADYPVPVFFDAQNHAYMNVLNNYIIRTSYWGKYPEPVKSPAAQQIFKNVMVPWRQNYIPKLRSLGNEFFDEIIRTGKINQRTKVICIIINKIEKEDSLNWNIHNIKEFAQLASHKGFKVIVFSNEFNKFYGSKLLAYEYDIRKISQAINNSWMVLSNDIDWLLISMMLTDAHLIARQINGPFDLFKNAEILQRQNDIFTDREWVSPMDAITICEGLL